MTDKEKIKKIFYRFADDYRLHQDNFSGVVSGIETLLKEREKETIISVLKNKSDKPYCDEKSPCGCHFGEVNHFDGVCFCDEVKEYLQSNNLEG